MIEAAKIWNEPNNKSHWDLEVDPEWTMFAEMTRMAGQAITAENPEITRVLGGMSPIDPLFLARLQNAGVLDKIDVVAVHGFPLDWNLWSIHDWPAKVAEIEAVTDKPVWVTEVGVSSFGAQEVQAWGLKRTAELLVGRVPRVFWYSSTICRRPGKRPRGTRRRRDPPTTGIFTWAFWTNRAAPSRRSRSTLVMQPTWACANGFISRTIGSMTR